MIRLIFSTFFVVVMLGVFASSAAADDANSPSVEPDSQQLSEQSAEDPQPARRTFDAEHRKEMYESTRLSRRTALLYTLAFPGLGNFYAEQYAMGTVMVMGMLFSGMFMGFGAVNGHPSIIRLGLIGAGVTYAGAAVSSYVGVGLYNDNLRRSLHVDRRANSSQLTNTPTWTIGWTWSF